MERFEEYASAGERRIWFDDPQFDIKWPGTPAEVSFKYRKWLDHNPEYYGAAFLKSVK